jgi:hypothetical protein
MSFDKIDGVMCFCDYKSFFKFINNWEGDLSVKKFEVFMKKTSPHLCTRFNISCNQWKAETVDLRSADV